MVIMSEYVTAMKYKLSLSDQSHDLINFNIQSKVKILPVLNHNLSLRPPTKKKKKRNQNMSSAYFSRGGRLSILPKQIKLCREYRNN